MLNDIPGLSTLSGDPEKTGVSDIQNALENQILYQDQRIAELTKALFNAQSEFEDLRAEASEVFSKLQGENEELSSSNRRLTAELKSTKQKLTIYEVRDGFSKDTIEQLKTRISGLSNRALLKFQRDLLAGSLVGITLVAGAILASMMGKAC
ncbi:MAG: hypothetical protein FJZ61_05755 [Chlamydiae bacterium]|nr:hypothetical protein [Chlamydiota bacterium]